MSSGVKILVYDRSNEFRKAVAELLSGFDQSLLSVEILPFGPHQGLSDVVTSQSIDAIVSPGNSYGFLNGGFDAAISSFYASAVGLTAADITSCLQQALREEVSGYNPPGNALVVDMASKLNTNSAVPQLIHIPTMSLPMLIPPSSTIVFTCIWNMLTEVRRNNLRSQARRISTILLPGMGTGVGALPYHVAARQVMTALNLFTTSSGVSEMSYELAKQNEQAIEESAKWT